VPGETLAVGIVSLPWFTPFATCYPALLLEALAKAEGMQVHAEPAYLEMAGAMIRSDEDLLLWKRLTHEPLLGDAFLLPLLNGWDENRHRADLEELAARIGAPPRAERDRLASRFAEQVEELCGRLRGRDLVAITATHYQLVSSILLAQRLKALPDPPRVVLGGYLASPAVAEALLSTHPEFDVVVYGEAEGCWSLAVEAAMSGDRKVVRGSARAIGLVNLDHDQVLATAARWPWIARRLRVSLELSRGCYWDQCDFCNFNAAYQGRFKSIKPARLIEQMDDLFLRHDQRKFQLLDTAVPRQLSRYLRSAAVQRDYDVFCEVRTDLTRDDLVDLTRLGTLRLQVGVESLVDDHLELMNKRATVADNIRVLRDCAELGIAVTWGVFVDHPKETSAHLAALLEAIRRSFHLTPPKYVTHCEVRAGSPLWRDRAQYGLTFRFPWRPFDLVLPPIDECAEFLPVIVRAPREDAARCRELVGQIEEAVRAWQLDYAHRGTHV
jgi:radical SAM family protein